METNLLAILDALREVYLLGDVNPLNAESLTVWTCRFKNASATITFGALFPYAIVSNDGALATAFEAHPRLLGHVSSAAFTSKTNYSFV